MAKTAEKISTINFPVLFSCIQQQSFIIIKDNFHCRTFLNTVYTVCWVFLDNTKNDAQLVSYDEQLFSSSAQGFLENFVILPSLNKTRTQKFFPKKLFSLFFWCSTKWKLKMKLKAQNSIAKLLAREIISRNLFANNFLPSILLSILSSFAHFSALLLFTCHRAMSLTQ